MTSPRRSAAAALLLFATFAAPSLALHADEGSLLAIGGHSTRAQVRAANARLGFSASRASSLAVELDPRTRLTASRDDGATSAPPSGLVSVTVRWAAAHAGDDLVTLHCAGDAAPGIGDYWRVSGAASGSFSITLPHGIGCSWELRYVRGGGAAVEADATAGGNAAGVAAPVVVATTGPLALGANTDAVGTRLAFGDAPGTILLTWGSLNATAPARVRVGTARGGPYPLVFTAPPPTTYAAAELCHAPANESFVTSFIFPGYFHTAELTLNASTRYWAVYGQEADAPEVEFSTRAVPGPDTRTRFAAFGDAATYPVFPGTVTTVDLVLALAREGDAPLDFVAVIGDLAYGALRGQGANRPSAVCLGHCASARALLVVLDLSSSSLLSYSYLLLQPTHFPPPHTHTHTRLQLRGPPLYGPSGQD